MGRLLALYLMSKYQRAMAELHQEVDMMKTVASEDTDDGDDDGANPSGCCSNGTALVAYLCAGSKSSNTTAAGRARILANLRFLVSRRGRAFITLVMTVPFVAVYVIVLFTDPAYVAGCTNCTASMDIIIVLIFLAASVLAVSLTLAWITRKYPDRWGQGRECRWIVNFAVLALVFFIVDVFTNIQDSVFDFMLPLSLSFAGCLGVSSLLQVYIAVKQERALRAARRVSKSVQSRVESTTTASQIADQSPIDALLADKNLTNKFEEHLAAELGLESLLFIRAVDEWKLHYCCVFFVLFARLVGRVR